MKYTLALITISLWFGTVHAQDPLSKPVASDPSASDPVTSDPMVEAQKLIAQAQEAIKDGRAEDAIDLLQKAIGALQSIEKAGLSGLLPDPPDGWSATEPQAQSGNWGSGAQAFQWTTANRRYTHENEGTQVEITITNSPQLVTAQQQTIAAFKNPQLAKLLRQQQGQKLDIFDDRGWSGYSAKEEEPPGGNLIAIKEKTLITIRVHGGPATHLDVFWKKMNLGDKKPKDAPGS